MDIRAIWVVAVLAVCLPACNQDEVDPFADFQFARPPSEDAVLLFVSGAWAGQPGAPRELFAVNADGSEVERLTTCTERDNPCDFQQVCPSTDRTRVAAVRGAVEGDPEASALFFVDLGRSVESVIALARRVQAADWSFDDRIITYSNGDIDNEGREDLYTIRPNGDDQQSLVLSELRERFPRIDFQVSNVVYESLEETPGKSRIVSLRGAEGQPLIVSEGGPGTEVLEGTPYVVGSDSTPAFTTNPGVIVFRRLTGTGNGGLGTWDIMLVDLFGEGPPEVVAGGGDVYRGAPDWSFDNRIVFVETDMAAGESRLVVVQPDGSERQVLHVEDPGFRMASPRWIR
jgi:Tol biopolymer transport system component